MNEEDFDSLPLGFAKQARETVANTPPVQPTMGLAGVPQDYASDLLNRLGNLPEQLAELWRKQVEGLDLAKLMPKPGDVARQDTVPEPTGDNLPQAPARQTTIEEFVSGVFAARQEMNKTAEQRRLPVAERAVELTPDEKQSGTRLIDVVIDIRELLRRQVERIQQGPANSMQEQEERLPTVPDGPSNPFLDRLKSTRLGRIATGFTGRIKQALGKYKGQQSQQKFNVDQLSKKASAQRDQLTKNLPKKSNLPSMGGKNLPTKGGWRLPPQGAAQNGMRALAQQGVQQGFQAASRSGASALAGSGGGAAAGGTALAGGGGIAASAGAGGIAAMTVATGGVALVGAAAVASAYALYELGETGYDLAYSQEQQARQLAYAAPQIQAALAKLDAQRTLRDLESGNVTAESYQELSESINALEEEIRPMKDAVVDLMNFLAIEVIGAIKEGIKTGEDAMRLLSKMKYPGTNIDMFPGFVDIGNIIDQNRKAKADTDSLFMAAAFRAGESDQDRLAREARERTKAANEADKQNR